MIFQNLCQHYINHVKFQQNYLPLFKIVSKLCREGQMAFSSSTITWRLPKSAEARQSTRYHRARLLMKLRKEICSELRNFTEFKQPRNTFSHLKWYFTSFLVPSIFLQEISQYFGNQVLRRQFEAAFHRSVSVAGVVLNGNAFSVILKELQVS